MAPKDNLPIRVHCTVDLADIKTDGDSFICTKCNRKLLNLCEGGDAIPKEASSDGKIPCGIYAGVTAVALASTLALSSCAREHAILPAVGTVALPSINESIKGEENEVYPEAKWAHDGFTQVYSPYSSGLIKIEGLPEGVLVNEPGSPIDAKKYFRLPQRTIKGENNADYPEGKWSDDDYTTVESPYKGTGIYTNRIYLGGVEERFC